MLINDNRKPEQSHVEFVSYTGEYPSLCCGVLTLRIDGQEHLFGSTYSRDDNRLENAHGKFWHTGGECYCGNGGPMISHGEWEIDVERLPEEFRSYADEIDTIFNDNVEHGCCGGCS